MGNSWESLPERELVNARTQYDKTYAPICRRGAALDLRYRSHNRKGRAYREATLDIRALPDEDFPALLAQLRKVINDPAIEVAEVTANATRPGASPSRLDTEAFQIIEAAHRRIYNVATLPTLLTGGTDMAQVRARGVQCYGIGPMIDIEDGPKGFGAHSDQERILEEGLHKFFRLQFDVVVNLAKSN